MNHRPDRRGAETLSLVANIGGIVGFVGLIVIAVVNRTGLAKISGDNTQLVVAVLAAAIAGLVLVGVGITRWIRRALLRDIDRGGGGLASLLGLALIALAVAGALVLTNSAG